MSGAADRISGGSRGVPLCPSCAHLIADKAHPGWGWCGHPSNRVEDPGWVNGFTPSQSPTGSCGLHPLRIARAALLRASGAASEGA